MSRPSIYFVRHGETAMNRSAQERVRGWSDPPLDAHGQQEVEQTARKFFGTPVHTVVTSPLQRAVATAQGIAKVTGARVIPSPQLLPWNVGVLTGKPKEQARPDIIWYMTHPDEPVPAGESYNDFYKRWSGALSTLFEHAKQFPDEVIPVVSHSRNHAAIKSILSGGQEPIVPGGGAPPGSISKLTLGDDGKWFMEDDGEGNRNQNPIAGGSSLYAPPGSVSAPGSASASATAAANPPRT